VILRWLNSYHASPGLAPSAGRTLPVFTDRQADGISRYSVPPPFYPGLTINLCQFVRYGCKSDRRICTPRSYIQHNWYGHALRILQRHWHYTFYVYQPSSETDDYRLVFIVSVSLLRKILNARQNYILEIVAYTFLDVQGGPKKRDHRLMTLIPSNLNRFEKKSLEDSLVTCS